MENILRAIPKKHYVSTFLTLSPFFNQKENVINMNT